jgi:hypothetical protein
MFSIEINKEGDPRLETPHIPRLYLRYIWLLVSVGQVPKSANTGVGFSACPLLGIISRQWQSALNLAAASGPFVMLGLPIKN